VTCSITADMNRLDAPNAVCFVEDTPSPEIPD
jgi:hypothetical protein